MNSHIPEVGKWFKNSMKSLQVFPDDVLDPLVLVLAVAEIPGSLTRILRELEEDIKGLSM